MHCHSQSFQDFCPHVMTNEAYNSRCSGTYMNMFIDTANTTTTATTTTTTTTTKKSKQKNLRMQSIYTRTYVQPSCDAIMRKSCSMANPIGLSIDHIKPCLHRAQIEVIAALKLPLPRTSRVPGGDFVAKDDTTAASVVHHPRMVGLSLPVGVDGTVEGVDPFCPL